MVSEMEGITKHENGAESVHNCQTKVQKLAFRTTNLFYVLRKKVGTWVSTSENIGIMDIVLAKAVGKIQQRIREAFYI